MGGLTDACNAADKQFTREQQDKFSARLHQKAAEAWMNGIFTYEVVPVEIPQRKGDPILFNTDEGVRGDTTVASLARLRSAFSRDGTIAAGPASQISDGTAAVVVMSKERAETADCADWPKSVRMRPSPYHRPGLLHQRRPVP